MTRRDQPHHPVIVLVVLTVLLSAPYGRAAAFCVGDCDGNCAVTVDEIIRAVDIALGSAQLSACPVIDRDGDQLATIPELLSAVNSAVVGCADISCTARCGDGQVQGDEECDDGGICIGGSNAGTACTAESQCLGDGVCVAGSKPSYGCAADSDCPEGRCVHCNTFGGDGCAANCTRESDVVMRLLPGMVQGTEIVAGTSGSMIRADSVLLPFPLTGSQVLTVGKERAGMIPVVLKSNTVRFAPSPLSTLGAIGCLCWRGVAARTCGGTLFAGGGSASFDCTAGFTAGDSVCDGRSPCAPVYGQGNSAAGTIGCDGLDDTDVTVTQDAGGSSGLPRAPMVRFSGHGDAGAAMLLSSAVVTTKGDNRCAEPNPAYGPDQLYCTEDDPPAPLTRGFSFMMPLVTGAAVAEVLNANSTDGAQLGPFSTRGAPFNCADLQRGDVGGTILAGAAVTLQVSSIGDAIVTHQLLAQPGVFPTSIGTATPPPTRTPTRTPAG